MVGTTLHALSVPFAVAAGSGAGLLSVLSWRALRDRPTVSRVVAALAVVMGVATAYHVLLIALPDSAITALLGGGKYLTVAGALVLAADLQRRTRIPIGGYAPSSLIVVAGALTFVGGGLATELAAPALVHWVHGIGALLVLLGLYRTARSAPPDRRLDGVIRDPRRVRRSEEWMRPVDDRILEACDASGLVLTPAVIAYNIGYSREEVNRRLGELERRSFVERVERGKYRITDRGRRYLSGPL